MPTDVRRWEDIDALVGRTVAQFGRVDVLVNNAGVLDGYATCLETSLELFDSVLAINLRGTFYGCKRVLAEMVPAGYGKIVNISSVAGLQAEGGGTAYTASKHAVVGLTRQIACEYGPAGYARMRFARARSRLRCGRIRSRSWAGPLVAI